MDIYLDKNKRWRHKGTNKLTFNPNLKRCKKKDCNNRVRNNGLYCSEHTDWSKTAHGASVLDHDDVQILSKKVKEGFSDIEITKEIAKKETHKDHSDKTILLAVRHHRRKYLTYRYNKFNYQSIKKRYGKEYTKCAICGWNKCTVDVHHILQEQDLSNSVDYHQESNLISLCPNHHRVVETMRRYNKKEYLKYILQYKKKEGK